MSQTCPKCDGQGWFESYKDKWSRQSGHYTVPRNIDCTMCEASGTIPSPLDFIEAHDGLSQEVADLLDTTREAADYILMEVREALGD